MACSCDGYGLPWTGVSCTPVCGDGLIRLGEICDDGNAEGGDGCDSACVEEEYYNCTGEPSNCTSLLYYTLELVNV